MLTVAHIGIFIGAIYSEGKHPYFTHCGEFPYFCEIDRPIHIQPTVPADELVLAILGDQAIGRRSTCDMIFLCAIELRQFWKSQTTIKVNWIECVMRFEVFHKSFHYVP